MQERLVFNLKIKRRCCINCLYKYFVIPRSYSVNVSRMPKFRVESTSVKGELSIRQARRFSIKQPLQATSLKVGLADFTFYFNEFSSNAVLI